jgi:hypothetical protein
MDASQLQSGMAFFEILPYLFIGDVGSLQLLPVLHIHQITTVILIRSRAVQQPCLPSFAQNFVYHIIGDQSGEEVRVLASLADSCAHVIEGERSKQDRKIVICDEGGLDRAASVVICYLIQRHGLSMVRAMEHLHICQPSLLLSAEAFRYCREFEILHQTRQPKLGATVSTDSASIGHKRSLDQVVDVDVSRTHKQPMLSSRWDENDMCV